MKIYVGNLDQSVNDNELRALFTRYGTVNSASVVTDKFSGTSRGFGFVEMSDAEAITAIKALDGQQQGGNSLRVNEARPQTGSGGGKRFGGGRSDGGRGGRGRY